MAFQFMSVHRDPSVVSKKGSWFFRNDENAGVAKKFSLFNKKPREDDDRVRPKATLSFSEMNDMNRVPSDIFGSDSLPGLPRSGSSGHLVKTWLYQVASDYERIEDETKQLKEENSRLRTRLRDMEELALQAQEEERQMDCGDAVEARMMTPARLPPLRGSDFCPDSVFSSAVAWLERGSRCSIELNMTARSSMNVMEKVGSRLSSQRSVGKLSQRSQMSQSLGQHQHPDADADIEGTSLFPLWFSPAADDPKDQEISANMKAEAQIDMWLQQAEARETASSPLFLSPVGRFRIAWDFIWLSVLAYDTWVLSFTCAFMANSCSFVLAYNIISVFLVLDICLNFFTGIFEGEKIDFNHRRIAQRYLSGWFWIDCIAAIPISTVFCFIESHIDRLGEGSLRFARVVRILKFVRLIRILKVGFFSHSFRSRYNRDTLHHKLHSSHTWRTRTHHRRESQLTSLVARANHWMIRNSSQIKAVTWCVCVLVTLTHVQGCIWGSWHPDWQSEVEFEVAYANYCQSLWWAYAALVDEPPPSSSHRVHLLETLIASERVVLMILSGFWVVFQGLLMCDEDAHLMLNKADALEYLQRRGVSTDTQFQLQSSFSETRRTRKLQRRFEALVEKEVSRELRHMIYVEMWGTKLISLGLINEMSHWHEDFLCRLTETVGEEAHGAKAVVCKAGDWATIAYHVLEGLIHIISDLDKESDGIPDFSAGMWVGEKALVSTGFRRSNSIVTTTTSTLMVVNSNEFHALIDDLNLRERFQIFCTDELWKGLCGRCGEMGDHFTDECPQITGSQASEKRKERHNSISRDLRMFIVEHHLTAVMPALSIMGISTLEDLESADVNELASFVEKDLGKELSATERKSLSAASIKSFKERTRGATQNIINGVAASNVHFIFLSHYKLEAGTEASLMRFELEQKLNMDESGHFDGMEAPVFLDSEDLQNLKDLQERVRNSHNIALILTSGVLTRPWCLIEIVTAWEAGIHILPVNISKPGNDFQYPKDEFYQSLMNGEVVDENGIQTILDSGFTLENVASAVQHTFKRIAVTYSPHRPATIRHSELDEFLRHCRYRSNLAGGRPNAAPPVRRATKEDEHATARRMSMEYPMCRMDTDDPVATKRVPTRKGTDTRNKKGSALARSPTLINITAVEDEKRPLLS